MKFAVVIFSLFSNYIFSQTINIESLQYHTIIKREKMIAYQPLDFVKLTMKIGMNKNALSKINVREILSNDLSEAIKDVEPSDIATMAKYDIRLKFYVLKIYRIILRTQIIGSNKNSYTIGVVWKCL